jgi:hypothetical protein
VTGRKKGGTGTMVGTFFKVARGEKEEVTGGPAGVGAWRRRREEGGGLARWSVALGDRQRPPAIKHGRRRCRVNRGGQRAFAMRRRK